MKRLRFFLPVFFLLLLATSASAQSRTREKFVLDPVLKPEIFAEGGTEKLLTDLRSGPFEWVSQEKTELRGANAPMTFMDLPVLEIVFRFKDKKLTEIFLSIYNRGDAGDMGDDDFAKLITKTETAINGRSAATGEDLGDNLKKANIRSQSRGWLGNDNSYRLDTAYSRVKEEGASRRSERPEFVNLTILPGGLKKEDLLFHRGSETTSSDLTERIQHLPNGDVLLKGVPMVDQGQKGYCAVATMERILRYYGSEVNQHELAQQANSSGEGGTDPESLLKALKGMGSKLGLRVNEKMGFDIKDFLDLVGDYNRAAKRKKLPEISLPGPVIEISDVYAHMNPGIYRDLKLKSPAKVERFWNTISESINQGRPVAWSVYLGMIEETPKLPQGGGGHMRLIIGFNPDKKEILYSDSWGYGHELKRMPIDDAYTITTGLYTVEPRP